MGNGYAWVSIIFLLTLVTQSLQQWDIWGTGIKPHDANLPANLYDDRNPGPGCVEWDQEYCKGSPIYNCLGIWQPCGRWRYQNNLECCYSNGPGKTVSCRMPNRRPHNEHFGLSHRSYCLPMQNGYDTRSGMSGISKPSPSVGFSESDLEIRQQEEIVQLLTKIGDALEAAP